MREEGDYKVWRWVQKQPHSAYLIALVAGRFYCEKDEWNDIELQYCVPEGREKDLWRTFGRTKDMLDFFSEYIGVPFPWEKYAQVCVAEFIYGGMENTSLTVLTETTLHDEKAHREFESEGLIAHELAHQWFGDLVTAKDWSNIWINEAFATYLTALYTRHWKGNDEFVYELLKYLDSYLKEYSTRYSRPVVTRLYKYPMELFDTHSYQKELLSYAPWLT